MIESIQASARDPCSGHRIGLAVSGATVAGSRTAGLMTLVARMKFLRRTGLEAAAGLEPETPSLTIGG